MVFSTENLNNVFSKEGKYENFKKLVFDLVHGNTIYEYDADGVKREISKSAANKAVTKVFMEVLGLSDDDLKSPKKRRRAIKAHGAELFEIIEDDVEFRVQTGFRESEWFNTLVESHNIADGDGYEFRIGDSAYFIVMDTARGNHDVTIQQIPASKVVAVQTTPKVIKIGKDLDLILLGRINFTTWVDKIADSFVAYTQGMVYEKLYGAAKLLPSQFAKTGTLVKDTLDTLIEDVSAANGSDVMIVGTKVALKKITAIADVDWASETQKESIAQTGRLGMYEGTELMEVPQRFALNDTTTKLVDNNILLVMPVSDEKFVKFVDEGETEIYEINEKGALVDDFETYEVIRKVGADVVLGQYFGIYTLS